MKFNTIIENKPLEMEFSDSLEQLLINTKNDMEIDCVRLSQNSYSLILDGKSHYLTINSHLQGYEVTVDNHTHIVQVQDELDILLENSTLSIFTKEYSLIYIPPPSLDSLLFITELLIIKLAIIQYLSNSISKKWMINYILNIISF